MNYSNDDRKNIGNLYMEMFKHKQNKTEKLVKEEYFPDMEDEAEALDGDLDAAIVGRGPDSDDDLMADALEEKVYRHMNEKFGESFRRTCDEIKEKFDLNDEEFCMFFKGWFDEQHVATHI